MKFIYIYMYNFKKLHNSTLEKNKHVALESTNDPILRGILILLVFLRSKLYNNKLLHRIHN